MITRATQCRKGRKASSVRNGAVMQRSCGRERRRNTGVTMVTGGPRKEQGARQAGPIGHVKDVFFICVEERG